MSPPNISSLIFQVYDEIPKDLLELVEDAVLCRRPDATERLLARAELEKEKLDAAKKGGVVATASVRSGEGVGRVGGIVLLLRAFASCASCVGV